MSMERNQKFAVAFLNLQASRSIRGTYYQKGAKAKNAQKIEKDRAARGNWKFKKHTVEKNDFRTLPARRTFSTRNGNGLAASSSDSGSDWLLAS